MSLTLTPESKLTDGQRGTTEKTVFATCIPNGKLIRPFAHIVHQEFPTKMWASARRTAELMSNFLSRLVIAGYEAPVAILP